MSGQCCAPEPGPAQDPRYRRVLWAALAINAGMFAVEIASGLAAGSVSLQADALDFLGDAGNYAISLMVLGSVLSVRARAALAKGLTMGVLGVWVVASTVWHAVAGTLPDAVTMGWVGLAALIANVVTLGLLWAWRTGDSNMRSVWLCSRNDVIGNVAVLAAAAGVFGTQTGWPDITVAAIMGTLALQAASQVVGQARRELAEVRAPAAPAE